MFVNTRYVDMNLYELHNYMLHGMGDVDGNIACKVLCCYRTEKADRLGVK